MAKGKGTSKGKGAGAGAHAPGNGGNNNTVTKSGKGFGVTKGASSGGRKAPTLKTVSPATTEAAVSASKKGPMRPGGGFSSSDLGRGGY